MNKVTRVLVLIIHLVALPSGVQASAQDLFETLNRPHTHLILRHAFAPGTGDPVEFDISNCSTQRNLNEEGKKQSSAIGEYLKEKKIVFDKVYSSQWCRCLDTAKLMAIGEVEIMEALNSIWTQSQSIKEQKTEELKNSLSKSSPKETFALVTHYANILALTGHTISSGEGLIISVHHDHIEVLGSLKL